MRLPVGCAALVLALVASSSAQNLIVTHAGTGVAGYSGDGGPALYSALNFPEGIALDAAGNLYVADRGNHRVRKITPAGVISTFAGTGSAGFSGDTGPATSAQLNYPIGLAFDGAGNLYIVDRSNQRVRKVDASTGVITTVAGNGTAGFSGDTGPATSAQLNNPWGIAADAAGTLYIGDQSNHRVRRVSSGTITTIAGTGTAGSAGDGGQAASAQLNVPTSLALDSTATNLYIVENSGHRVRKIILSSGVISTFAGTGTAGFSGDGGPAASALLNSPLGVSVDSFGNVYISDRGNQRIRRVDTDLFITTVAGNGTAGFSGNGGLATAASLQNAIQAVADSSGVLYITDFDNHRIRRVQAPTTGNPTPVLTALSPSSIAAGTANFTVTAYGSSFVPGATVRYNGADRATTFVSPTILTATILASDVVSVGVAPVTVFNSTAGGGGGTSTSQPFTVFSPPAAPSSLITTFAGNGYNAFSGDGGPALYASFSYNNQMVFDAAGNLYVADYSGNNRVRKIDTSGNVTTIAGGGTSDLENIPATAAQLYGPTGLALDGSGNLFIAEYAGHRIRKVVLATGNINTYAGPFPVAGNLPGFAGDGGPALSARFNNPHSLVTDPAGNLYVSDRSNHRIRKIDTSGNISTFAGNGIAGFFGDGGPAIYTPLNVPLLMVRDSSGNLYVAESASDRVRKIDPSGTVTTVAGTVGGFTGDGGPATSARLQTPAGLALDASGNLYITDQGNVRVRQVTPGGTISTVAGIGSSGFSGDGGLATAAQFNGLEAMAFDSSGRLYVADRGNFRIRRIQAPTTSNPVPVLTSLSPAGIQAGSSNFTLTVTGTDFVPGAVVQWNGSSRATVFLSSTRLTATISSVDVISATSASVTVLNPPTGGGTSNTLSFTVFNPPAASNLLVITVAGTGLAGYSGDGGPALYATLNQPRKMVFDAAGNMYVADYSNHRVRKITPAGIITTVAGTGTAGSSGDTGPATFAQLNGPIGVALDGSGNLYIGEYGGHRVRKVTPGGIITTLAGTGVAGFSGDTGAATSAQLYNPFGIWSDGPGNVYIADHSNHRVRKVSTTGIITTVAGTGVAAFYGDGGPAITSPLYYPIDVTLDAAGSLYIADQYNHRIRKVDLGGIISTVAGSTGGFGGDGGPATSARLSYPAGIAWDAAGNMYIADQSNHRVRLVNALGIITTIAGDGTASYGGDGVLATLAQFYNPQFVTLDAAGNLYIADVTNDRIRKLVPPATGSTAPVLSAMTPSAAQAGGASFTLTATGSNFVPGAIVRWNGSDRSTSFVSSTQLRATINNFDIASVGTAAVTVFNPGGGGGSNSLTFNIIAVPAAPAALITTIVGNGIGNSASGDGGPALFASIRDQQGLVYDAAGNLYIADYNNHRVRKVTPGGTITTFAGTGTAGSAGDGGPATFAQLNRPVGLAIDGSGNIYIAGDDHRVRQVTPGGIISTYAGTGTAGFSGDNGLATSAQLNSPDGLAVDSAGNLYIADTDNHRVRKVSTSGTITTVAGNGVAGYFGDGGPATASPIYYPTGLAMDSANNLYIADHYNHRIRKVDASGNISTVAGNGSAGFAGDGGPATSARIYYPVGVVVDSLGNLYIGDNYNHRVRLVSNTGIISTVAGNGTAGFFGDGGLAINANLYYPTYVALDPSGQLLISDTSNWRVRKLIPPFTTSPVPAISQLNPSRIQVGGAAFTIHVYGSNFVPGAIVQYNGNARTTNFVSSTYLYATINNFDIVTAATVSVTVLNPGTGGVSNAVNFTVFAAPAPPTALIQTVFGTGYAGFSGDGGPAQFASLNQPHELVLDASGNFYVADSANHRVRKISSSGVITTIAGTGTAGSTGDGGPATLAQLNNPIGVALDNFGNLYISEYNAHRIRKVVLSTGFISTVAGTGTAGFSGDGNAATLARLNNPFGLVVDSAGNLFIGDRNNHRVRKVDTSGNISTYAGTGVAGYFGDGGPATTTPLNEPLGLALDPTGNLYIADYANHRIRRVAPDGTVFTVAGNGSAGFAGDGGPAIYARLYYPTDVFLDLSGNLFISDHSNQRIRMVSNTIITTIAGNGTASFTGDGSLATSATMYHPIAVVVDAGGNVFFTERDNALIRKILAPPTNNPVPVLGSLLPGSAQVGGGTFTMVVRGTNFVPGSTVQWNGVSRTTTFVNSTQLNVVINNFDIALVGTNNVTVVNSALGGGGGTSNTITFLVFPTPTASTAVIGTSGGTGTAGFSGDTGAALSAQFNNPHLIAFDAAANLYIADYSNNRVRKIAPGGIITTVAGGGASLGDGGPATSAQLNNPVAVVMDGTGNLYISEYSGHRIRKVNTSGIISTIAGNGTAGFAGDGGPAVNSQLRNPNGLALDSLGNLYFADGSNYRVRKIDTTGNISTVAGNGISGYFGDGGPAINSPLVGPAAVAVDASGNLFIADYDGNRIRKVDTNGIISTYAGTGSYSFGGDGGAALYASFRNPFGLALDSSGNLFVADRFNNRIRKIDSTNIITTVAGTGAASFSGDGGLAAAATLNAPTSVALDPAGNLYISDTSNHRIRQVPAVAGTVCLYSISPGAASFGAAATTGSLTLTTSAGCFWTASANVPWLTITSATASAGPAVVNFSVAANTTAPPRSGTLTVAGLTYTATQAGTGCSFTLLPTSASVGAATSSNTVNITAPAGCPWTAVSNSPFLHITAGSSGSGNGTLTYSVDPNPTGATQSGSLTIAGQIFAVTQAGATCTYSLLTTSANYTSSAATGTIGIVATTGCTWTAASSAPWLTITSGTSGSGTGFVAYAAAANTLAVARNATITISGTTGLIFTVNQQGFTTPSGSVTAGAGTGAPGGTASIPVVLNLPTGQLDSITFGISVAPVGGAPPITGALSFAADPFMPTPTLVDSGTPSAISIAFLSMTTPVTGTTTLGQVRVSIPGTATIGQSYTVTITAASGSSAGTSVTLSAGPNSTLLISNTYLVGDADPDLTDLNGDTKLFSSGEFGNGTLDNLDLILGLRQVTLIPGFVHPSCSDRFDAMDSFPVDGAARGGNGSLDNLDLIQTLRRLTGLDMSRPTRGTRGLVCTASAAQPAEHRGESVGWLELGGAERGRIPVYLHGNGNLLLAGFSFSVGGSDHRLEFTPVDGLRPTLIDNGVDGYLSLAWLDGFYLRGGRVLIGYVEGAEGGNLRFYAAVANSRSDGKIVSILIPEVR